MPKKGVSHCNTKGGPLLAPVSPQCSVNEVLVFIVLIDDVFQVFV